MVTHIDRVEARNVELEVWSRTRRPAVIQPVTGFAAVVGPGKLKETVPAVLDGGGWVFAALRDGELVGYASVVRVGPVHWLGETIASRWMGFLELGAIEVARAFRGTGIGRRLAAAVGASIPVDEEVLMGVAVVHHWDLAWSSLPPFVHRGWLESTLRHAGMSTWRTEDPEVKLHAANALFARVPPRLRATFEARL